MAEGEWENISLGEPLEVYCTTDRVLLTSTHHDLWIRKSSNYTTSWSSRETLEENLLEGRWGWRGFNAEEECANKSLLWGGCKSIWKKAMEILWGGGRTIRDRQVFNVSAAQFLPHDNHWASVCIYMLPPCCFQVGSLTRAHVRCCLAVSDSSNQDDE